MGATRSGLRAGSAPEAFMEFDTQLKPRDLDPEHPSPIETPWGSISLFAVGAEIFAVQSFCPHLEGPLFQGTVSGETVTCPWHAWSFSLRTGARTALAGIPSRKRGALLVCEVSLGPRGTLLLSNPRGGSISIAESGLGI